jgi:hypothetical protein
MRRLAEKLVGFVGIAFYVAIFVGYFLGIQNLFEYWPESDRLGDAGSRFIWSVIGVFVPPIGVFLGWAW